jgi:GcrA cell cycle regulator
LLFPLSATKVFEAMMQSVRTTVNRARGAMSDTQRRWPDELVVRLKHLWAQGLTAAAIARQLGVSRSAVMGQVDRIRRQATKSNGHQGKAVPLGCSRTDPAAQSEIPVASLLDAPPARRRKSPDPPAKLNGAAKPQREVPILQLTNRTCRWPLGTPGTPHFRFCCALDANLERGAVYCTKHRARAYTTHCRTEKEDF